MHRGLFHSVAFGFVGDGPKDIYSTLLGEDLQYSSPAASFGSDGQKIRTPERIIDGRVNKWKSKLLDLTLRNRLLNFKQTHANVKLICPDPHELEDMLSDGKEFKIKVAPQVMAGNDPRSGEVYTERTGRKAIADFALDALRKRELVVDLPEEKLDGRLALPTIRPTT